MFSDKATAPYYSSAFSTLLVLISTSMGEGADFGANFWFVSAWSPWRDSTLSAP